MSRKDTFIIGAVRTPIGKFGGMLSSVRTDDLAAHVIRALMDRFDFDPAEIDDVKSLALPVLRHRVLPNFNAEAEGMKVNDILKKLIEE